MDKEFARLEGVLGNFAGRNIITSNLAPKDGNVYQYGNTILVSPTNDLVWKHTWEKYLERQRQLARDHLELVVYTARLDLGLEKVNGLY